MGVTRGHSQGPSLQLEIGGHGSLVSTRHGRINTLARKHARTHALCGWRVSVWRTVPVCMASSHRSCPVATSNAIQRDTSGASSLHASIPKSLLHASIPKSLPPSNQKCLYTCRNTSTHMLNGRLQRCRGRRQRQRAQGSGPRTQRLRTCRHV